MKKLMLPFGLIFFVTNVFAQQSVANSTNPSLILCKTKYALCSATDCIKNGDQASCNCPVYVGENWGAIPCEKRVSLPPNEVYSEYSPLFLLASPDTGVAAKKAFNPVSFCPSPPAETKQYADCLDALCTLNGNKNATCTCPVVTSKAHASGFFIQSNNCDEAKKLCQDSSSSSDVAANSAPAIFSLMVVESTLQYYGKHLDASMFCLPKHGDGGVGVDKLIKKQKDDQLIENRSPEGIRQNQNSLPNSTDTSSMNPQDQDDDSASSNSDVQNDDDHTPSVPQSVKK